MNKTFGTLLAVILVAGALLFVGLHFSSSHDEAETIDEEAPSSHIEMDEEKAKEHGISIRSSGPGKLEMNLSGRGKVILHPDHVAHILPKISGVAKEARKNRGDTVEAGEVIAVLESREMAETKANYLAALQKENLATSNYEREDRLYQKRISSEQEFLNAHTTWQEAKIQRQLAKQKLLGLGLDEAEITSQNDSDLRYYEIRSPIKGTVIDRDITFGEYVEDRTPIYTIADLDKVWVEIGVYPNDFHKVKEGQIAEISLPGEALKENGKIIYISPIIDADTITANAVVELDNAKRIWKPGSFVATKILMDGVVVPLVVSKKAIQVIDGEQIVFVRTEAGFEKTPVRIGRSDDKNAEVIAGLDKGVNYACTGTFLLKADLGKDSVEHED